MTCFYSLTEQNAQLREENERLRSALEWIVDYSAYTSADVVGTLPAAYMRGFTACQKRAWAALANRED